MSPATSRTRWWSVPLAAALALAATSVPVPASAYSVVGPSVSRIATVVALGDSVAYGTRCGCVPYPQQSAARLSAATRHSIRTYNHSVPGSRSGDVLALLRTNTTVMAHVRTADVVEVEVGANDVGYGSPCWTKASCYASRLETSERNVDAIVARIHALAGNRRVAVVVLGYWNVWLDGKYAAARGAAYVSASRSITLGQNAAYLAIARARGAIYVDAWRVFRGTNNADDTWLLASDGDHPNAKGQTKLGIAVAHAIQVLLPA